MSRMIYLDNAATTWPKPEMVYQAVNEYMRNVGGSPGRGSNAPAREASRILFEAREALAALFGVDNSANIMFAANATEAINIALFGTLKAGDRVVTTSMEHNAVARPLKVLAGRGIAIEKIMCDKDGELDLNCLEAAVKNGVRAVVLSHASNVTGKIVPLAELAAITNRAGSLLIVDAAQTAGVEEINVQKVKIDMLAFSGHKGLLGPQGTGGLYVREGIRINPLRYGGTGSQSELDVQPEFYPDRLESGTPNTPGIAGLLAGVRFIKETGQAKIKEKEGRLCGQLIKGLTRVPGVRIYGPGEGGPRTATVSFTVAGMDSGEVAMHLDRDFAIACRSGLHCAPWAHETIGTLATGTVRLSPGYFNTDADIAAAINAVESIVAGGGGKEDERDFG